MADGVADGYLPGSIKEFVKYGVSGLGALILAKKFAPGLSLKAGISDGVWLKVKASDGSDALQWSPSMPTKAA